MDRLWGEVAPVPEENVVALAGGEEVEGFRVEHVPGHASHHLCWLDLDAGDAFVGDMAGVRVPPAELTLAPTPPPEIDVEAWLDSVDRIEALSPHRLRLTHFGLERGRRRAARPGAGGAAPERRAGRSADARPSSTASRRRSPRAPTGRRLRRWSRRRPPEQQWLGLERYLRKRAESERVG